MNRTNRFAPSLLVGLVVLSIAALSPSGNGGTGLKSYADPVHKFSMMVFNDWKQVPIESGEPYEVLKYYEPSSRGTAPAPRMVVVRFEKGTAQSPLTGVDAESTSGKMRRRWEEVRPKDTFDLTFGRLALKFTSFATGSPMSSGGSGATSSVFTSTP